MSDELSPKVEEVVTDLAATVDYIRGEVTEVSDQASFEELVAYMDAVYRVKKAADEALSMLQTAQLNQLEYLGSRQVGSRVFARVPKRVERFNHGEIASAIAKLAKERAIDPETGEFYYEAAVAHAIQMMQKLYIAPASKAKTTALDEFGVDRKAVVTKESKGFEIKVVDLDEDDE